MSLRKTKMQNNISPATKVADCENSAAQSVRTYIPQPKKTDLPTVMEPVRTYTSTYVHTFVASFIKFFWIFTVIFLLFMFVHNYMNGLIGVHIHILYIFLYIRDMFGAGITKKEINY